MRNDEITGGLNTAIEEAGRLNQQAGALLQKAITKAMSSEFPTSEFRYTHALRLLRGTQRQHVMVVKYLMMRTKKVKALAAKAGK